MAHGYLRDYDEGWTTNDSRRNHERGDDRDRRSHDQRDRHDRNFMFDNRDRGANRSADQFRDEDRQWRGSHQDRWSSRDWRGSGEDEWRAGQEHSAFTSGSDWNRAPRNFSSRQDDHYRSWRDKQMQALDRDYADYCREREEQFHRDFDSWRSQRGGNNPGPLRTGMTGTGQSLDPTGTLELTNEATDNEEPVPDPTDAATLGTNSSDRGL